MMKRLKYRYICRLKYRHYNNIFSMTLTLDKRPEQGLYFIWIKQTMCNSLLKTEEIDYS